MANVSRADKAKRLDKTLELLAFHTHGEVIKRLCRQFKVVKQTANGWIIEVRQQIMANIHKPREEWVADTLHQLNEIIRTDADKRLEALKQRTCLLGLNAPTNVRIAVEGMYQGPDQWKALGDKVVLEQAMALEVEIARVTKVRLSHGNAEGNGGGTPPRAAHLAAEQLRMFGLSRVPISASPPDLAEGGAEFTAVPRSSSADCGDACQDG